MPRTPLSLLLALLPVVGFAQDDLCIDTAWMNARAALAQNDTSVAIAALQSLRPPPSEGLYSMQWPLLLSETIWHTGDWTLSDAFEPREYRDLVERFDAHLTGRRLLEATDHTNWPEPLRENFDYNRARTSENAVLNAYYYGALNAFGRLMQGLGRTDRPYAYRAKLLGDEFDQHLVDPESLLVRDAPESTNTSIHANAIAAAFGIVPERSRPAVANYLLAYGLETDPYLQPYVIEGLFVLGYPRDALGLITEHQQIGNGIDLSFLIRRYTLGMVPVRVGWTRLEVAPVLDAAYGKPIVQEIVLPSRRISARYMPEAGLQLTVAPGTAVTTINNTGLPIMVKNSTSHAREDLTQDQKARLKAAGWAAHVGDKPGIWVDVESQMLRLIENGKAVYQARCATAAKGVGSQSGSLKTPLGWHAIAKKYGADAPWGQVFRARQPTREIWKPGDDTTEDLVLTRVMHLDGLEPGRNKGGNVDSFTRNIYIHGTNGEALIGTPSSHGCIRMLNDDVIDLYERVDEGTKVLITDHEDNVQQETD